MRESLKNISYFKDLILVLTFKEIKVKYKSSFFGYLWSLLHPLSLALVFYFAFKLVMKVPLENFTLFLISGLFPWQWFSNSVGVSANILLANSPLIKKVNFPRYFIPLSAVFNDAFHFLVSLPVIAGFVLFYEVPITVHWLCGIPLFMLSQFLVTFGITLMVSSINLFFRDMERLVMIGLNILFYLTPIIYDVSLIPERFRPLFLMNPLFGIIEGWHHLFLKGTFEPNFFLHSLLSALIILGLGMYLFKRLSLRFAEVL